MHPAIFQNQKFRIIVLLCFHGLWGIFLGWGISKYGLGTSRDSAEYLFTSLNLSKGLGLISFAGQPYVLWPPLYPFLLALLQWFGFANPLDAAVALQWLTFGWIALLVAWLFSRIFVCNFAIAFMGNAMVGTGVALTMLFPGVGSDYLHLALALSMVCLSIEYMETRRLQTAWLMALVSALAMLQRYIGITVLFTGILIVFMYSRTTRDRLLRSGLMSLSAIPVGMWVLSISVQALERGAPSSLLENTYWFTVSALTWFFPYSALIEHPFRMQMGLWIIWLSVVALSVVLLMLRWKRKAITFAEIPILLFGLIYTVVLLMIASLSYFNRLDGRFVAPAFIPFVVLLLMASETVLGSLSLRSSQIKISGSIAVFGFLVLIFGLSAYQSVILIKTLAGEGQGYTSREWYNNQALEYWLQHQPVGAHLTFSNYPAGVAVHSWQATLSSPRRTNNPNSSSDEPVYPLIDYVSTLFENGKDSYLIWIEPNSYTHVYTVDELRAVAKIEVLYESEDGGVYKLRPLK